jgi:hypothetical protein
MDIVATLLLILPLLEAAAKNTATVVDDFAVEVFRSALDNPAIAAWIDSLLKADHADRMALACGASPEVQAGFAARGIDWQKVVSALPTILKIVALFA